MLSPLFTAIISSSVILLQLLSWFLFISSHFFLFVICSGSRGHCRFGQGNAENPYIVFLPLYESHVLYVKDLDDNIAQNKTANEWRRLWSLCLSYFPPFPYLPTSLPPFLYLLSSFSSSLSSPALTHALSLPLLFPPISSSDRSFPSSLLPLCLVYL